MLTYRLGNIDDIGAVYALNHHVFTEAWSLQSLTGVMQNGFNLYVCESDAELVAYVLSQDILDETHIMQLAVEPSFQRQGLGRKLSQLLIKDKLGASLVMLEVRASNIAAQALYAQLGFVEQGRRKAYYTPENKADKREDAVLMQLHLSQA